MEAAPSDLLDRERELTAVDDVLTDATRGRGRVVLVEAPAGLGKTSLLRAAAETASEAGFTGLSARANELERDFAFGCVRLLLEPVAARASDAERDRLFNGAAAVSAALFGAVRAHPAPADSFAMLHGIYWLLNNLAEEGPVAVFVDDLHWSDAESLRFLNYLTPRLDGLPLAVIAAARTGENRRVDLARIGAGPDTVVLRPGPLGAKATMELCRSRLPTEVAPEFAAACLEATGGNPFFLESLLREAIDQGFATDAREVQRVRASGPAAVAQAVLLRLSGRPAAATALVRAVAVLGDGASLVEAARLAQVAQDEGARAADLLTMLGLVKAADGLEFAHPIVREAVYPDMGAHEREVAHARAVTILVESGATEERIAAQIARTDPGADRARVELLRRVAAGALDRGAPSAAAAWLERAVAEPPPPDMEGDVLLELGSAELLLGSPASVTHLSAAVELSREPGALASSVRRLANALTMAGDSDGAVRALESAIPLVEADDRELALLLEAELGAHAQEASLEMRAPAATRLERRRDLKGTTPGERLVLASLAFERARVSESAGEAAAHIERALADGRLLGEQELEVAGTFYLLVVGLLATDALDLADASLDQALADATTRASTPALAFVILYRARVAVLRGAVAQAEADARTALELLTSRDIRLGTELALAILVTALAEAGELDAADHTLRESALEEIPPGLPTNPLLEARGCCASLRGVPVRRWTTSPSTAAAMSFGGGREPARLALALARGVRAGRNG